MRLTASFVATTWLLAMLPGVGQALMVRQTLAHGRRAAWASIAGTSTGLVVWSLGAAAGLSTLLLANPAAYTVLRWGGGCFLAVMGVKSLLTLRHGRQETSPAADGPVARHRRGDYAAGLATNLGNPKAGVFAISLLPQFVPPHGHVFWATAGLGLLWASVTGCWYLLFVWAVGRGRSVVTRPVFQRWLDGVSAAVLLALGAGVALGT